MNGTKVIFRTEKSEDAPAFAGQVSNLDKQKATAVIKMVTGEEPQSMAGRDGQIHSAQTESYFVNFIDKKDCADLFKR